VKIEELSKITPIQELVVIMRSRELRQVFADMAERTVVPALYETENNNEAQAIFHYLDTCGSADWYVFEVDLETGEGFGFVTFSGDITDPDAEFGYVDLKPLINSARINLDLHFGGITKADITAKKYAA